MPQFQEVRGIVVHRVNFQDTSRIVTLLSEDNVLLDVMVKGARRPKSPFLHTSEPFLEVEYFLHQGSKWFYLKEARLLDAHGALRRDIKRLTVAGFACELLRGVLRYETELNAFLFLQTFLQNLEKADGLSVSNLLAAFLAKLTAFLGFRLRLDRCLHCDRPLRDQHARFFDIEQGGVVCTQHRGLAFPISEEDYKALRGLLIQPFSWAVLHPSDHSDRLARWMLQYYCWHTQTRYLAERTLVQLHILDQSLPSMEDAL